MAKSPLTGIHPGMVISGDVVVDDVTVNQKGGSLTATLKKMLRTNLNTAAGYLLGARMDFAGGTSCVLMTPALEAEDSAARQLRVTRVSPHRFLVDLVEEDEATVDPMTEALLVLLQQQVTAGGREIAPAERSLKSIREIQANSAERLKLLDDII